MTSPAVYFFQGWYDKLYVILKVSYCDLSVINRRDLSFL